MNITCVDRKEEKGESDASRDLRPGVGYKSKVANLTISRSVNPTRHGGTCKYSVDF
jgi:hypothetical protein